MNKLEFLTELSSKLHGLPKKDIAERLNFYSEMIDDRIEAGLSESEAINAVGNPDKIAEQIIADTPFSKIAKERIKPSRKLSVLEIVLLVLGSPIWLSLLIALIAVIFSVYVSLWSVVIALWSVFVSLLACGIAGIIACPVLLIGGKLSLAITLLGGGMLCGGLSIFMFYACKYTTKGILFLTKKIAFWIKNCFIRKEKAL